MNPSYGLDTACLSDINPVCMYIYLPRDHLFTESSAKFLSLQIEHSSYAGCFWTDVSYVLTPRLTAVFLPSSKANAICDITDPQQFLGNWGLM